MNQINSKQDLINFFEEGCKKESHIGIGVEHEKFIFENHSNKRINFEAVSKIFGNRVLGRLNRMFGSLWQ